LRGFSLLRSRIRPIRERFPSDCRCPKEVEQYVLIWGTHATVVELAMRERVGKTAQELAGRYADDGV
jgi:hypothetical protein